MQIEIADKLTNEEKYYLTEKDYSIAWIFELTYTPGYDPIKEPNKRTRNRQKQQKLDGFWADEQIKRCPKCNEAWQKNKTETDYYDIAFGIYKEWAKCPKCN